MVTIHSPPIIEQMVAFAVLFVNSICLRKLFYFFFPSKDKPGHSRIKGCVCGGVWFVGGTLIRTLVSWGGGEKQSSWGWGNIQEGVGKVLMPSGNHHPLLSTLLVLSHHSLQFTLLVGSCPYGHSSLCPHRVSASSPSLAELAHLYSRMSNHRNTGISVLSPTLTLILTLPLWSRLTFPHPCSWGCLSLPLCPSSGGCSCPLPRMHMPRLAMLGPEDGIHTIAHFTHIFVAAAVSREEDR